MQTHQHPRTTSAGRHARIFTAHALHDDAWEAFGIARAYGTQAEIEAAAEDLRKAEAGLRRSKLRVVS